MRLQGKKHRNEIEFAIERIRRTIMTHTAYDGWSGEWRDALKHLTKAQKILNLKDFFAGAFDHSKASCKKANLKTTKRSSQQSLSHLSTRASEMH